MAMKRRAIGGRVKARNESSKRRPPGARVKAKKKSIKKKAARRPVKVKEEVDQNESHEGEEKKIATP